MPMRSVAGIVVLLLVLAGVALAAAMVMGHPLAEAPPASSREGPVPVRVTVETNLPVRVRVVHAPEEHAAERITSLGESPHVRDAEGAHVGDTLVLSNRIHGLSYEVPILFGEPQSTVRIVKEFKTGLVRFRGVPHTDRNLFVYLNDLQVAPYFAGVQIELVEGHHTLEIRGPRLPEPAQVEVEVQPGQTVEVDPPRVLVPVRPPP